MRTVGGKQKTCFFKSFFLLYYKVAIINLRNMDFESQRVFNNSDSRGDNAERTQQESVSEQLQNESEDVGKRFIDFLELQLGRSIDSRNADDVLGAIEEVKATDAYEALPLTLAEEEAFILSLKQQADAPEQIQVDPVRLSGHIEWINQRRDEKGLTGVTADRPGEVVDAYELLRAQERTSRAYANGEEVDDFYDAPPGLEEDIRRLKEAA